MNNQARESVNMHNMEPLKQHIVFTGPVFDVVDEQIRFPTGKLLHHFTVRYPRAVVFIPYQGDGTLLVIQQYRHSVRKTLLEFPAGTLEPGEVPLEGAKRELAEEVGQAANRWEYLGELHPAPGFCNEVQQCFFATELWPCEAAPDEDELIEVVPMQCEQVEAAIRTGDMTDGKSIALYTRAKLRGLL
jgi:ADP-ribose pyrophosphatase